MRIDGRIHSHKSDEQERYQKSKKLQRETYHYVKKNEERAKALIESMSNKRYYEEEHRQSVRDTTSYSKTLNKTYIGLSSQTRLNYRQKLKAKDIVSQDSASNIKSARS
jgi:hypothetical protein